MIAKATDSALSTRTPAPSTRAAKLQDTAAAVAAHRLPPSLEGAAAYDMAADTGTHSTVRQDASDDRVIGGVDFSDVSPSFEPIQLAQATEVQKPSDAARGSAIGAAIGGVAAANSESNTAAAAASSTPAATEGATGGVSTSTLVAAGLGATLLAAAGGGGGGGSGGSNGNNGNAGNQAPTITSGATASFAEDTDTATAVYTTTATDPDDTSLSYSISGADVALLSIDADTGAVTLRDAADYDSKPAYDFRVTVTDPHGNAAYKDVHLAVVEVAGYTSAEVDDDNDPTTPHATDAGNGACRFREDPGSANNVVINHFGADDAIVVIGSGSDYSFTSRDGSIEITANTGNGIVSKITLAGLGITGFVGDEASAELALGQALGSSGPIDFFRASDSVEQVGSAHSLDYARTDSNLATPESFDASQWNFAYTEDAAVPNNARINGFGAGDTITVTGADTSDYAFTSRDGNIEISFNDVSAGAASTIVLVGKAGSAAVFDEASAEAAVGFDFFQSASPAHSLDADSDGDTSTVRAFDASNGAIRFTEDARVSNNAAIDNFAQGDSIVVSHAAPTDYSFTSRNGNIEIVFNNQEGNAINSITLVGKAGPGFVDSEASAEIAVGFDFFRFA